MNSLFILLKKEVLQLINVTTHGKKSGLIPLLLYGIGLLYFSVVISLNSFLHINFKEDLDLVLYFISFVSFVFSITYVFVSKGYLFGSTDFEFLMSLPFKSSELMLSKIFSFYILQLFNAVCFLTPTYVMYGINSNQDIFYYIFMVVGIPFVLVVPVLYSVIIAIIIKFFEGQGKFSHVFNLLIAVAIVIFIIGVQIFISNNVFMLDLYKKIADLLPVFLPLTKLFIVGLSTNDFLMIFIFIILNIIVLILVIYLFEKVFVILNQRKTVSLKSRMLQKNDFIVESQFIVLVKRELHRFISNIYYLMNMGIGLIILLLGLIYMAFNKETVLSFINVVTSNNTAKNIIAGLFMLMIGFMTQMNIISCVSISLEGKRIGLLKSLPIEIMDLFWAKIIANFIIVAIPGFIGFLLVIYLYDLNLIWIFISLFYYVLLGLFEGMFGLTINLFFPKMDYDNEIVVIKQSASSFIATIANMLLGFIPIVTLMNSSSNGVMMVLIAVVLFYMIADIFLYYYLSRSGKIDYMKL